MKKIKVLDWLNKFRFGVLRQLIMVVLILFLAFSLFVAVTILFRTLSGDTVSEYELILSVVVIFYVFTIGYWFTKQFL